MGPRYVDIVKSRDASDEGTGWGAVHARAREVRSQRRRLESRIEIMRRTLAHCIPAARRIAESMNDHDIYLGDCALDAAEANIQGLHKQLNTLRGNLE